MFKECLLCCLCLGVPAHLFGAHPLVTDDAGTVSHDAYELELGYADEHFAREGRQMQCGFSLKYGITGKMDLGVSFPYHVEPAVSEPFGAASLGVKFSLLKDVAAVTFSNELGSREYFINAAVTGRFFHLNVSQNLGYATAAEEGGEGTVRYSTAFSRPAGKCNLVGEVLGDKVGFQRWLAGIQVPLMDGLVVDGGYGNGFRSASGSVVVGVHVEFK